MKKSVVLMCALLVCVTSVIHGRLVSREEALAVSFRLIDLERTMPHLRLSRGPVQFQSLEPLVYRDEPIGFVVHLSPRGFLIMPGWTEDSPMKFISFSGDFAALADHPFILQILDGLLYTKARLNYTLNEAHAAAFGAIADTLNADQAALNDANWARFLSDRATVQAASEVAAVAPLLASKWDEKSPFNQYAPKIGTRTPYAGAAAVAQAQLMYFWKHPTTGEGSHSYTWSYYLNSVLYSKTLSADFNHEYYWDRMIDDYYSVVPTTEQKDAVARLMSDVGISIDMSYSLTGSFTDTNASNSLVNFFQYSPDAAVVYRNLYPTWADWFNVLKEQADNGWPSLLTVFSLDAGTLRKHVVVVDGYCTSPSNMVHVRMGWGGDCDNYYDLSSIFGYGDAVRDYAVINIHPPLQSVQPLTVTAPNGGETWPSGAVRSITWNAGGITGTIKLVLFQDGVKKGNIAMNLPAESGSYAWTVGSYIGGTATVGAGFTIRAITMDGQNSDYSDAPFAIAGLTLTAPNGGETWSSGATQNITWSAAGVTADVKLVLFKDGVKKGNIALNLPVGSGSYAWTVGAYIGGTAPVGSGYTVRIVDMNGVYSDYGDTPFAIAGVTITSPNGGEAWNLGISRAITWSASGVTGSVKLVLFKDGVKVGNIALSLPVGSGSYAWTVGSYIGGTAAVGAGFTVRVLDMNGVYSDYSDNPFSIGP